MKKKSDPPTSRNWTFLTNHTHVLACLSKKTDYTLREVANEVGITERAVQRIVRDLEEAGVLKKEKEGRKNHYFINFEIPLRHHIESHKTVGGLLKFILKK